MSSVRPDLVEDDIDHDPALGRSDWAIDVWDQVGEVPAVEPLPRQNRIVKWVMWAVMALVIVLVLIAGWVGWWYVNQVRPDGEPGDPVAFTVEETDTLESVTARLQAAGLIVDGDVFKWYVEQKGGLELTPGYYQLPVNDHMGNVLARLRTPPAETYHRVTFPEGFTIEQMADRLAAEVPRFDREAFLERAHSPFVVSRLRPAGGTSLEGLLFPDTYQVSNADNEAQVVERMVALMERVAIDQEDILPEAEAMGLRPYDVLIVASMIEKEAKIDADRPKIARVIYNRLFIGMPLQIDATLLYGQPKGSSPSELSRIDGPYNTYMRDGLPPTPIANPGRASIRAALNPSPNPSPGDPICRELPADQECLYIYYVLANEEGGHAFAATREQHEANVAAARAAGLL